MKKNIDPIMKDAKEIMQEHGWTDEQDLAKAILLARRNAEYSSIRAFKPVPRCKVGIVLH